MLTDDLNTDISNVVDFINIKGLPEIIVDFLHSQNKKKYNNLRKFYSGMLDFFGEDIKASYLNRILKYLSSDKASNIYLIDGINDGIYDKELSDFTKSLVKEINSTNDYLNLYETLNRKVNFIFYESHEEFCTIKDYNNEQKYEEFIFSLLKHAFKNYQESVPEIVARSLFIQSQTMNSKTSNRIRFLNASSILGNEMATINLYCSLISVSADESIKVLMRTKESEIVLWSIGFDLENNFLSKEVVNLIKNKYKYIFNEKDEFIKDISVTEKGKNKFDENNLLLAYQIYYYCYNKYGFTKAGNSLGKLLLFDILSYKNNHEESIKKAKEFLKKEIRRGNVNAITNLAVYLYEHQEDAEYDYKTVKKWFETSASFGDREGNYYLGKILFDQGKYDESFKYIEYAANSNDKCATMLLGRYYEKKDEFDNAIKYYKKAIVLKYYDAAYYLALLYFNMKELQKDNSVVIESMGYDILNEYYDLFTDSVKEKAKLLLEKNSGNF